MITKRISVNLTDDEYKLIKWLADRDNVSVQRELRMIFGTELYQLMELYYDEMMSEE